MKIEMPDDLLKCRMMENGCFIRLEDFKAWFKRRVEGKEVYDPKDAVEVFRHPNLGTQWDTDLCGKACKEKALLINIQPTQKETAKEFIAAWLKIFKEPQIMCVQELIDLRDRAKAVLEVK